MQKKIIQQIVDTDLDRLGIDVLDISKVLFCAYPSSESVSDSRQMSVISFASLTFPTPKKDRSCLCGITNG
jgi:hypothetical protein